jgi:autotransporter adhesin
MQRFLGPLLFGAVLFTIFSPKLALAQFVCVNGAASTGGSTAAAGDVACGINNTTTGGAATGNSAIGVGNTANGFDSSAIGGSNTATGFVGQAVGLGNNASGALGVAYGINTTASGTQSAAFGNHSTASGDQSLALGSSNTGATASGASSTAIGNNAIAGNTNSIAIGTNSTANFVNSTAFGNGASATRDNQQVFGTATNTYTMSGIASSASKTAQTGPVQLVTSDAGGNLATSTLAGLGLASATDVSGINSRLDGLTDRSNRAYTGVAMAFAMAGVPTVLPNERFAVMANWGTFQGTSGLAFNAAARITNNVQFNAGLGYGPNQGIVGGRAGIRVGW